MTPSSVSTRYEHRGCCTLHAGKQVDVVVPTDPERGTYTPAPAPYCLESGAELWRVEVVRRDGRRLS